MAYIKKNIQNKMQELGLEVEAPPIKTRMGRPFTNFWMDVQQVLEEMPEGIWVRVRVYENGNGAHQFARNVALGKNKLFSPERFEARGTQHTVEGRKTSILYMRRVA